MRGTEDKVGRIIALEPFAQAKLAYHDLGIWIEVNICRKAFPQNGAMGDMVYTEFVSADALIRSVGKTMQKLNINDEERPVAVQIYEND